MTSMNRFVASGIILAWLGGYAAPVQCQTDVPSKVTTPSSSASAALDSTGEPLLTPKEIQKVSRLLAGSSEPGILSLAATRVWISPDVADASDSRSLQTQAKSSSRDRKTAGAVLLAGGAALIVAGVRHKRPADTTLYELFHDDDYAGEIMFSAGIALAGLGVLLLSR